MFQVNDDLSIYVTRGDMVFLRIAAMRNGSTYTFEAGEVIRIKVYGKKDAENVVLQKDFPVTATSAYVDIILTEEDTKIGEVISKHKDYWYEVELNPYDDPMTIIGYDEDGPKIFRLFPEGADIPEYVPDPEVIKVIDTELDMTSERPVQNQVIARAFANLKAGYEAVHDAVSKLHVTPQMFGAVGDGVADDTEAFKRMIEAGKKIFIPTGDYLITDTLDCEGASIEGSDEVYLYFANTSGDGLICGYGNIKNINLVMENGFSGSLLKVYEGEVNSYPDRTTIESVSLYSLNDDYKGTFVHIKPYNNFGGVFEKIKIGRISKKITVQSNRAEKGVYIEIAKGTWASGYNFKDIIIDAYVKKPLTIESPDYYSCMNFTFENIQIQNKHNAIGFKHEYLARFYGVQDLYLTNCKIWDFSYDYCKENVIYSNCTNVVIRNSPVFEKYYNEKNPFTVESGAFGYKENLKLYNSGISQNNGFVGMSEILNVGGSNSQAVPYLIPHNYSEVLHSKLILDLWTRVSYGVNCGDTMTHVEMVQTSYANNIVYMHYARSLPVIKKLKKYKEGLVIWLRGGIGDVNLSYMAGGKIAIATDKNLTNWDETSETVKAEAWSDTSVIPHCKTMTILYGTSIDANTSIE